MLLDPFPPFLKKTLPLAAVNLFIYRTNLNKLQQQQQQQTATTINQMKRMALKMAPNR